MQQNHEYVLEQSRTEKLIHLGFLCYNLYVDATMVFPEMCGVAEEIKRALDALMELKKSNPNNPLLQMQEAWLNDKLAEMGCICYNLYIDSKLINNKVLSLCDSITSINREIIEGEPTPAEDDGVNDLEAAVKTEEDPDRKEEMPDTEQKEEAEETASLEEMSFMALSPLVAEETETDSAPAESSKIPESDPMSCSAMSEPEMPELARPNPSQGEKPTTFSKMRVSCPFGMELIPAGYKRCGCGYRNRPEARFCGKCGAKLP